MNFTSLKQLDRDLWVINELDKAFIYLINGTERALLLDTGLGISNLPEIVRSICGEKPLCVVNSHAHGDHNSGNYLFPHVYVGRFDEPYSHRKMTEGERKKSEISYFVEAINQGYCFENWKPGPCRNITTVKTGDIFQLGNHTLEVIEIPGHTAGSIALLDRRYGWLFSGDIVLTWQTWAHLTNCELTPSTSLRCYLDSIRLLKSLRKDIRVIFPSHGTDVDNPDGYTKYTLKPEILDIYDNGIKSVIDGTAKIERFESIWECGWVTYFSIGGIVFQKDRIDSVIT